MNNPNNKCLYDNQWSSWVQMKIYGPASRWLRYLISELSKEIDIHPKSILDVGCGEGTNTLLLSNLFPEAVVKGIDFSVTAIKEASRISKKNLVFEVDLDSKNLDNKYDLVTCFEVLEHVDDWKSLLNRIAKSSNQYIMLSFPTGRMRGFEVNVGHLRNFKKGEVEVFLQTLGFKKVKIFYAGFPFYSPIYRELCNLTNSANNSFTMGKFTWKQKLIADILYITFRFFSTKNNLGDQFCGLFTK